MKKFIIQLGVFSVFLDTNYIIPRRTFAFDVYDYYFIFIFIILYYLFTKHDSRVLPNWFIKWLAIFLLGSAIGAILSNKLGFPFYKQIIGIFFSATSYFLVVKLADFRVLTLFKYYLKFSYITAIFAIIEEFAHLSGIHYKTPFLGAFGLYRVSGFSGEPYFLATVLIPSMFYFISRTMNASVFPNSLIKNELYKGIIISVAFALTFSSSGVVALLLILLWNGYFKGMFNSYRIIFLPAFAGLVIYLLFIYKESDVNFERRYNDSITALSGVNEASDITDFNSSSFSLASNYLIMKASFVNNPAFGIGIGNYEFIYNKYFDELFGEEFRKKYLDQNAKDGNSTLIRLLAETGIWGTLIYFIFIMRSFRAVRKTEKIELRYLSLVNQAIFLLILIRLLRTGNYLGQGFFFIFFLYFYSQQILKNSQGEVYRFRIRRGKKVI